MSRGSVSIVGAGPGAPDLMTVRGLQRLREADVVAYDRLIAPDLLAAAPVHAERVYVGKAAGFHAMRQADIEALLVQRARSGKRVVRLKGGDPFLFGRGAEELRSVLAAGIPCEVVPGISSALAAPAAAGIPVTHRGIAPLVTIVTGHEDPASEGSVDWEWLARGRGTLVILMGLDRIDAICARLLAGGRAPDGPAAVVAAGTLPQQHVVAAPLHLLAATVQGAAVRSPAVIVVGDVVRLLDELTLPALTELAHAV